MCNVHNGKRDVAVVVADGSLQNIDMLFFRIATNRCTTGAVNVQV